MIVTKTYVTHIVEIKIDNLFKIILLLNKIKNFTYI